MDRASPSVLGRWVGGGRDFVTVMQNRWDIWLEHERGCAQRETLPPSTLHVWLQLHSVHWVRPK